MKSKNDLLLALMPLVLAGWLSGCATATPVEQDRDNGEENNTPPAEVENTTVDERAAAPSTAAVLNIGSGCRGCGRCVSLDAEHFAYRPDQNIPAVISQDNLGSAVLQNAINACPTQAISLTS